MHESQEFTKTQLRIIHGLAFIIPMLILGTIFAINGVYPFGDRQILVTDMWHQYFPFISEYWHRLRGGGSLLWSWNAGGGHDYIAHIAYYMASPFNLLAALFPHYFLREVLTFFLLVKLGLAGLFMSFYLRFALGKIDIMTPVFATLYSMSSFVMAYYWNIMWMDSFALMPLIILGVHYLVTQGKYLMLTITLALGVLFNFYIGVFLCIFVALTFFAKSFYCKITVVQFIQRLGIVVVAGGLALGISAVITIPTFSALQNSYRSSVDFPTFRFIESFVDVLGNFNAFTPITLFAGLPNIYTGMISLMLVPIFLMSGKISIKEKVTYMILITFLVFSVNVNVLDFMWNAFTITNSLPFRFSFIVSFLLAVMAYRAYTTLDEVRLHHIIGMAVAAVFFVLMGALGPQETTHIIMAAGLGVLYLIVFAIIMLVQKKKPVFVAEEEAEVEEEGETPIPAIPVQVQPNPKLRKYINIIKCVLFVIVIAEVSVTAYNGSQVVRTTGRYNYPLEFDQVQMMLAERQPLHNADFFRTEMTRWWSTNDPSIYNFYGLSFFSSMANVNVSNFMDRIGLRAWPRGNSYLYAETSPLTNAFLNVRYLVSRVHNPPTDSHVFWETVAAYEGTSLIRNTRYLPFGFMAQPELIQFWGDAHNPFNTQNELFRLATGIDQDLFTMIDVIHVGHTNYRVTRQGLGEYRFYLYDGYESGSFRFNYYIEEDALVYGFIRMHSVHNWRVTYNRQEVVSVDMARPYLFFVGEFEAGQLISFEADSSTAHWYGQVFAATLDRELFDKGFELLSSQPLELTLFTDTRVEGVVTATQRGVLYTSLPHSGNWRVFVNGQRQELITIGGAMSGVMLDAGTHEISFRFYNRALTLGTAIAAVSLAIFALLVFLNRKGRCPFEFIYGKLFGTKLKDERIKYLFFGAVTTLINWAVYSAMVAIVGLNVPIGNTLAWVSSVIFAFVVNKLFVFQNTNRKKKVILQQMLMFLGARIASGIVELVGVPLLYWFGLDMPILGIYGFAAKLIVSVFVVILNYILSKTFVFKERT